MEFNKFFQCKKLYTVCDYFPKSQREYSFYWLHSQFQNNITNNLSYFKYDINNIKLFTNGTYEGISYGSKRI